LSGINWETPVCESDWGFFMASEIILINAPIIVSTYRCRSVISESSFRWIRMSNQAIRCHLIPKRQVRYIDPSDWGYVI